MKNKAPRLIKWGNTTYIKNTDNTYSSYINNKQMTSGINIRDLNPYAEFYDIGNFPIDYVEIFNKTCFDEDLSDILEEQPKKEKIMSTRIRYVTISDKVLETKTTYFAAGKNFRAALDTEAMSFSVLDDSGATVVSGSATDLALLKKATKAALATLGVAFGNETRKRI